MIRSERDYQEALERLEQQRAFARQQRQALAGIGLTPEEVERGMAPLLSFQAQLQDEVAWYERAKRGDVESISSLAQIGRLLVAARLAAGLNQSDLAERLGVSEAQVSRDERNEYHGITVERAQRILSALRAKVKIEIEPQQSMTEAELASVS